MEYSGYGYDSLGVFGYSRIGPVGTGTATLDYHSVRAGLPLRCLVGRHQFASADQVHGYVGAWPVPRKIDGRFLPLCPIWPGFLLNTLLYAAILWLLIPGPFALRRFLRVRRGRCPKCAYPMGESAVCTECGRPLPRRRTPDLT